MDFIQEETRDLKNIFNRFKKRNFSGNAGQAVKNSSYHLTTNIVAKIGSLVFIALLARILLPELFGLYSLALGTIIFFSAFSNLGLDSTLINFVSKSLNKNNPKKAKAYFKQLTKYKIILIVFASALLLSLAGTIATEYYQKPIFFALLAGGFYLPIESFSRYFSSAYIANNNFKINLIKEIIFQIARLILVSTTLILFMKMNLSGELMIFLVILIIGLSYLISFFYLIIKSKKYLPFLKSDEKILRKKEKRKINQFTLPLTATILSGIFFGYIDTIMLGRFVTSEFIGYYTSAFSLIGAAAFVLGFAATAMFPIFSRMKGKNLNKAFNKVLLISFLISFFGAIFIFIFAKYIIILVYGLEFIQATLILRIFSIILVISTLTGLYGVYFISQEKTKRYSQILISVTLINIFLNYFLIKFGLKTGNLEAVIGACIATIISRILYLAALAFFSKRK